MGAFLPRAAPAAQRVLTEQINSGAASHLILLGITGAPPAIIDALSEGLAARLRQRPEFIDVLNGDDDSFAAARDFIWHNRYLLAADVTAGRFTAAGLHAALRGDLGLLGSDLAPLIEQSLPSDPTGEALALLSQLGGESGPASRDNVWISADGTRALLLVHSRTPGFDLDAQQRALALIGDDFSLARAATPGAGAARLLTSGPGVFADCWPSPIVRRGCCCSASCRWPAARLPPLPRCRSFSVSCTA